MGPKSFLKQKPLYNKQEIYSKYVMMWHTNMPKHLGLKEAAHHALNSNTNNWCIFLLLSSGDNIIISNNNDNHHQQQ